MGAQCMDGATLCGLTNEGSALHRRELTAVTAFRPCVLKLEPCVGFFSIKWRLPERRSLASWSKMCASTLLPRVHPNKKQADSTCRWSEHMLSWRLLAVATYRTDCSQVQSIRSESGGRCKSTDNYGNVLVFQSVLLNAVLARQRKSHTLK